MKIIHSKSPCCQETIYYHGGKRRVCSQCGKTWTIRPKKRGRKSIHRFSSLVREIINSGTRLTSWANRRGITTATASEQLQSALSQFISKPASYVLVPGPYAVLVDGLWFNLEKQDWVMFLVALKPVSLSRAYFLDPILLPGGESYENWTKALTSIPNELKKQVKAVVSDGFRVSNKIAIEQNWIHQRCHFHLISYLQVRRGKRKRQISGGSIREAIYQTIMQLLKVQSELKVKILSARLVRLSRDPDCPKSMRMIIAEFLRSLEEFRAYINHPELHLPTTTGSVETMCKLIRKRVATVRTTKALKLWATAVVRLKSPITCNGKELST